MLHAEQEEDAIVRAFEMKRPHPLSPYVPEAALDRLVRLIDGKPIRFVVEKHRRSKHGDYRPPLPGEQRHQITVNGSLNPYAFLITALHEYAHFVHRLEVGNGQLQPHGAAWKRHFQKVMQPFLHVNIFPQPLLGVLVRHMQNPKASSTADHELVKALKAFDQPLPKDYCYLYELEEGVQFITLDGYQFRKGKEQRKRIICERLPDGRMYRVHPFVAVKRMEP